MIQSDIIIITEIYGAREKPIKNISSEVIVNEMKKNSSKEILYIKNKNEIPEILKKIIKKNDMIICMGAGKINSILNHLINIIKGKYEKNY